MVWFKDVVEMPDTDGSRNSNEDVARELSTIHKICSCHMKDLQNKSITQVSILMIFNRILTLII